MVVDSFELPQQGVRLGIALRDRATFGWRRWGENAEAIGPCGNPRQRALGGPLRALIVS
jgi:hypothetical protein